MFHKVIYLIIFPVLSSCHMHYCVDIFPDQTGDKPRQEIRVKELVDTYRDGTDGIDIIDIPFV